MEKHIMGENGISYTLGEDGLYYPDLYLPEETEYPMVLPQLSVIIVISHVPQLCFKQLPATSSIHCTFYHF